VRESSVPRSGTGSAEASDAEWGPHPPGRGGSAPAQSAAPKKPSAIKPRVAAIEPSLPPPAPAPRRRDSRAPSEWSSLLSDLGSRREPEWHVHDRTHLEFALDYPVDASRDGAWFQWDAYFFVPRSLFLNESTYHKGSIYEDLRSHVRLGVPVLPLEDLTGAPLANVTTALNESDDEKTLIELRLFACLVRASARACQERLSDLVQSRVDAPGVRSASKTLVARFGRVTTAWREILPLAEKRSDEVREAARWCDEDISRVIETILAWLAIELDQDYGERVAGVVASGAVAEARYRTERGYDGVGSGDSSKRDIEHLEYRRHVLKRFTSSVLWLSQEIKQAGHIALHVFYSVAAGVAMAFAVAAAAYHGQWGASTIGNVWAWGIAVVIAYIFKDRIKAVLQTVFSKWIARRFPDRRWTLRDRERDRVLGAIVERSGFISNKAMPPDVRARRFGPKPNPLEVQTRPEDILWHQKVVKMNAKQIRRLDPRFASLKEIFRLDLLRWLNHTDDPKQRIVFADPVEAKVYSANAPRVYNIGIVYRLISDANKDAPWRRARVVVSRKGIVRIDHIA
jgi:hypothetical protein